MKITLLPSWHSIRRPLGWILFFTSLLSGGALLCIYYSPRGIDFHAIIFFTGIPLCMIFVPICIIFLSFKIQLNAEKLILYKFFIPVKTICYNDILEVKYEKISNAGQMCVVTFTCCKGRYSYPIRLFSERKIKLLIDYFNQKISEKKSSSNKMNTIAKEHISIMNLDQLAKEWNQENDTRKKRTNIENRKSKLKMIHNDFGMNASVFMEIFRNKKLFAKYLIGLIVIIIFALYCKFR